MVPKLKSMIGSFIFVSIISAGELEKVKLLGVEFGGIWIESKKLIEGFLALSESKILSNTPIIFIPYSRLSGIITVTDVPTIGEKLLEL
jgi:hypothetical protein